MSESPGTLAHYDTGIHPGQLSSRRWPPHPQIIKKCIGSLLTIELVCVMGQSPRAAGLYIEFHKTQIDIKVAQSVVSVTVAPLTCFGLPEPTEPWTCGNLQASDSAVTCGSEGPSPSGVLPQQAGFISPTLCLNSGLPNPATPELWCPVREAKRTVINWVTFVYKGKPS